MTHIPLPDEQWAELLPADKVPERKRRAYLQGMTAYTHSLYEMPLDGDGKPDPRAYDVHQDRLLSDALDLLVIACVKAWSFEPPVSVEALLDLPKDAFDELRRVCMAMRDDLMPDYRTKPDPKAPSGG